MIWRGRSSFPSEKDIAPQADEREREGEPAVRRPIAPAAHSRAGAPTAREDDQRNERPSARHADLPKPKLARQQRDAYCNGDHQQ